MTDKGLLRVRAMVDRWFLVAIAAALLVVAVGGVLAHGAYVDTRTHQEQRVTDEWSVNGSFTHRAVVTNATEGTPFQTGETVRERTVYFQGIMPVLEGEFVFKSPNTEHPVNLTIDRRLVVQSVDEAPVDGERTTYWQQTMALGVNRTTQYPDDTTTAPFGINVTRTIETAQNVSKRLDSPGDTRIKMVISVLATRQTVDAQPRQFTYSLTIVPETGIYRVQADAKTEQFTEMRTVSVPNEPTSLQTVGGPLLVIVGGFGVSGLAFARYRGMLTLTTSEREWLAYRDDRSDFDEWITTFELPDEAKQLPVWRAASLADLVNFAIDTDSAVIEAPGKDAYHVVHDRYRYTFETPRNPREGGQHPAKATNTPADETESAPIGDGTDTGESRG